MKTRLFILCLFFIVGLVPQANTQVESIQWGEKLSTKGGLLTHKYFIGKTNEHFYYITSPFKGGVLRKYDYSQKEIYAKELDLTFGEKKLTLYSFIESNGKTYAILKDRSWKAGMDFYVSEFKNDEFGEITQPYDSEEFKNYASYFKYFAGIRPYHTSQNAMNTQTYYQQSADKKYFAVLGATGSDNKFNKKGYGLIEKLGLIVLDSDMKVLWQRTIKPNSEDYISISQFQITNNGDVFVILEEEIKASKKIIPETNRELLHITKDSEKTIPLGLEQVDIVADLGFFNSNNENEIFLAGIYDKPDQDFIKKDQAFEGFFFFKYNTQTKEHQTITNKETISSTAEIKYLVHRENDGFYLMMQNDFTGFYYNSFSKSSEELTYYSNIRIFKLNQDGEKTHYKLIRHKYKADSRRMASFIFSFYNDKLFLAYSNELKKEKVEDSSTREAMLNIGSAIQTITLNLDLEPIPSYETTVPKYIDKRHYLIPHFSFTHKDKIVLCGIRMGRSIKIGTLTLK